MKDVVILSAVRVPMGKFLGTLSPLSATDIGGIVIKEAVKRASIEPSMVDEVIMGNVVQAGVGQSPARQAEIKGGIPPDIAAFTVNKVCGSGMKAVMLGAQAIKAEDANIVVTGGMESMSNCPFIIPGKSRKGHKLGNQTMYDAMIYDGLWDSFTDQHMGLLGEFTAEHSNISRESQDEFAYNSHMKAIKAIQSGLFKDEIIPVQIPQRKGEPIMFDTDETPRSDTSIEKLSRLRPAFKKDGTVTAGNAPSTNDGASALVVSSDEKAKELGIKPLARIIGYASGHTEPKMLFYAPPIAVRNLLKKTGMHLDDFDLIEMNEAFAVQCLADIKELGADINKINVNGGAVALGHPIGASGARILTTLIYALKHQNKHKGLATLCLGGGGAVAMAIEMIQ